MSSIDSKNVTAIIQKSSLHIYHESPTFARMTIPELKAALLNREYEDNIRISEWMVVLNAKSFLRIQFADCERAKEPENCPAYIRLMLFYEATKPTA